MLSANRSVHADFKIADASRRSRFPRTLRVRVDQATWAPNSLSLLGDRRDGIGDEMQNERDPDGGRRPVSPPLPHHQYHTLKCEKSGEHPVKKTGRTKAGRNL